MRSEFIAALKANQNAFGMKLTASSVERLADYYELVQEHNPLLHLVAPCPPEEFAVRHILESLTLLEYLPKYTRFADVGAGAGLPSIPCLLSRKDLSAVLIESKEKKVRFLENAINELDLSKRASIINRQFTEADPPGCEYITCRALDRFSEKLSSLFKWAKGRRMLLFGGKNLAAELQKMPVGLQQRLVAMSEQRFLFIVN